MELLTHLTSVAFVDRVLSPFEQLSIPCRTVIQCIRRYSAHDIVGSETIRQIRRLRNPELEIEGVLLTMFDDRTNLSHQVMEDLKGFFGDKLFSTIVPRNIRLGEAPSHGRPITVYDPSCKGAIAYRELAKEVLAR